MDNQTNKPQVPEPCTQDEVFKLAILGAAVELRDEDLPRLAEKEQAETVSVLDKLHVDEINNTLDELERLERAATPGPWALSPKAGDAVINPDQLVVAPDCYGGRLVFESCGDFDRKFICALRNAAKELIRQAKNAVRVTTELDRVYEVLGPQPAGDEHLDAPARVQCLVKLAELRKKLADVFRRQRDGYRKGNAELLYQVGVVAHDRDEARRENVALKAKLEGATKERDELLAQRSEILETRNKAVGEQLVLRKKLGRLTLAYRFTRKERDAALTALGRLVFRS
jgi:hypothetical protein